MPSARCFCSVLSNIEYFRKIVIKAFSVKFHQNTSRGSLVVPCGRWADITRRNAFRNIAKPHYNSALCEILGFCSDSWSFRFRGFDATSLCDRISAFWYNSLFLNVRLSQKLETDWPVTGILIQNNESQLCILPTKSFQVHRMFLWIKCDFPV